MLLAKTELPESGWSETEATTTPCCRVSETCHAIEPRPDSRCVVGVFGVCVAVWCPASAASPSTASKSRYVPSTRDRHSLPCQRSIRKTFLSVSIRRAVAFIWNVVGDAHPPKTPVTHSSIFAGVVCVSQEFGDREGSVEFQIGPVNFHLVFTKCETGEACVYV